MLESYKVKKLPVTEVSGYSLFLFFIGDKNLEVYYKGLVLVHTCRSFVFLHTGLICFNNSNPVLLLDTVDLSKQLANK